MRFLKNAVNILLPLTLLFVSACDPIPGAKYEAAEKARQEALVAEVSITREQPASPAEKKGKSGKNEKQDGKVASKTKRPPLTLTLAGAESLALRYSLDLKSGRLDVDKQAAGIRSAIGGLIPDLNLQTTASVNRDDARALGYNGTDLHFETDKSSSSAGLTLSQPVYTAGRITSLVRQARLAEELARENLRLTRSSLLRTVRHEYYQLLLADKRVDIQKAQVDYAQEFMEKTKGRYEAGEALELDVLQRQVDMVNEKTLLITWQNSAESNRNILLNRLGLPLSTPLKLAEELKFEGQKLAPLSEMVQTALDERPELKSAYLQIKQQEEAVRQARSTLFPQLTLSASYGLDQTHYPDRERSGAAGYEKQWNESAKVGLQLDWNFFDGGESYNRLKQERIELEKRKISIRKERDSVLLDVENAYLDVLTQMESVRAQQENVAQARKALDQQLARWEIGEGGGYLNVIDARDSLATAEENYYSSISQYYIAITDLEYARAALAEGPVSEQ